VTLRLRIQLLDGGYQEIPLPEHHLGIDIVTDAGCVLTVNRGPNDHALEIRNGDGGSLVYLPVANNSGYAHLAKYHGTGPDRLSAWLAKAEALEHAERMASAHPAEKAP
jgi:hypothetical protein